MAQFMHMDNREASENPEDDGALGSM